MNDINQKNIKTPDNTSVAINEKNQLLLINNFLSMLNAPFCEVSYDCLQSFAQMAIENARDVYTRRMEGVSIWVVESKYIHASNPDEAESLYDPANDKVYRHPTFYDLPDEVKHM